MKLTDQLKIEILADGVISVSTDKISGTNHVSADEFLAEVSRLSGGERVTTKKKNRFAHSHSHSHGVVHSHG